MFYARHTMTDSYRCTCSSFEFVVWGMRHNLKGSNERNGRLTSSMYSLVHLLTDLTVCPVHLVQSYVHSLYSQLLITSRHVTSA